ncbi:MFS transporter [Streptomonospora litoralis]|uniref:Inner membrane protein YbjJ n=1 Tax=Streptomonospora litoralis TaxID=2498135 RepID=A0A4P6Q220_9ACTN|nr:MFS transporter [Streptomonospora litoralis]QBI54676.1 Inner membrane protein YbjJ [Streptomonospora litoralis]
MAVEDTVPGTDRTARRARSAVAVLFLANGFAFANIVPWMPAIKSELELSNTELGTAIGAMPLGALVTGMLAGPLIARFGSGRVSVASGLLLAGVLPLVATAPAWWALAAALFCVGWMDAWMDSAMNAHGLRVQRRYGRTIINTFHGLWSVAAVAGGLAGSAMAGAGVPRPAHIAAVTVVLLVAVLAVVRQLLPGPETDDSAPLAEPAQPVATSQPAAADASARRAGGSAAQVAAGTRATARPRVPRRSIGLLLGLSVLLMMAGAIEDSAASWGAVYMRDELAAPLFLVGLPFVACQTMMTVGRLTGDRITDRFGAVAVARTGALLSAAGMALALLISAPLGAVVGFGLMGLGVATLFPLALAAAGEIPGLRGGHGVALAAWLARLGFLAVPPLIGVVADAASLTAGLWLVPAAGLVAAVLAVGLHPAASTRGAPSA